MKIIFFLAVWRRPEITEICFMGLNRLKDAGLFPVDFLAVISEESMIPLCKKYGVDYVMHENLPLGKKKNFGLTQAMNKSWDYLVELGSDDLLKIELIEAYLKEERELMHLNNLCFLNSENGECRNVISSTSYGMGRAIRRDILEKHCRGVMVYAKQDLISPGRSTHAGGIGFFPVESGLQMEASGLVDVISEPCYKLWNDTLNRSLDNNSNHFMHVHGVMDKKIKFDNPVAIDIKGKDNIWPWAECGTVYDLDKCLEGLSTEEKVAIKSLW